MYDKIIKNGQIVNGKNEAPYLADIGIVGDTITAIGDLQNAEAKEVYDAANYWVTPGFVDCHCHSDAIIMHEKKNSKRIMQGITTEIIGNCGISPAPINPLYLDQLKKYCAPMYSNIDLAYNWENYGDYLDAIEKARPVLNVAALVGHGTIRAAVMGFSDRKPTSKEMDAMKEELRKCLSYGAVGMSTGLVYPPGFYSEHEELIELCRVLKDFKGVYTTHMRSETFKVVESVADTLELARSTGVNTQISHHKASGIKNKGKSYITLLMIAEANKEGLPVTCDVYPYTAASTQFSAVLPPYALEGGVEKLMQRLSDPEEKKRIKASMMDENAEFENISQNTTWDKIIISQCSVPQYEGKSVKQIAEEKSVDEYEATFSILLESKNQTMMIVYLMDEQDVANIIKSPYSMISSDGIPSLQKYHPRYIGAFARVLDYYTKKTHLLSLPEAICKMTKMPAEKFGLARRGVLEVGMLADIAVIDFENFRDNADYANFDGIADGIKMVFINGEVAVQDGEYTGLCAGRVLRR